jgi:V8-like Glu-specific endopeptidase
MWLFNAFPSERVARKYGFSPSQEWLDHVRLSAVRIAGGCSASFVSENGLVMTNHHCAHACLEQLSTAAKNYVASGFYAKSEEEEQRCPEMEINQLLEITDVTAQVQAATAGRSGKDLTEAQRAVTANIEKACATSENLRCEVVSLYHGGRYDLYKYRRYQDVRLVFAPEFAIAFFGGDPDNFEFPRYDLDVSFLRVYEDGRPAQTPHHFTWSPSGPKEGQLTFVAGNPGSTSRELTIAQLQTIRDVAQPSRLYRLARMRGALEEFQRRGPEEERISTSRLFGVENAFKSLAGREAALLDEAFFAGLVAREDQLRAAVAARPEVAREVGDAWDAIAAAEAKRRVMYAPYTFLEGAAGFQSELFHHARTLVRAAEELPKPNEQRLREFGEARLPSLREELFSTAPIHPELEILLLTLSLEEMRATLGPDDPTVKAVLGQRSPIELATALVQETKLGDPKLRRALFEGGKAAVEASHDPMIELAQRVDPAARAVRKRFEDEVEGPERKASERIVKARFAVYGTTLYPDATFTPRLSFGQVKGWMEGEKPIAPFTTFAGAFERATGRPPFALPESWIEARPRIDPAMPLDFCSTNDIVGGNSGSPIFDQSARIVGVIFDGNIHSLSGDYAYDPSNNRAVSVDSAAILHALDVIYDAKRVRDELVIGR